METTSKLDITTVSNFNNQDPAIRGLADHIVNIARHERIVSEQSSITSIQVELERVRLNEVPYFQPDSALRRLTQPGKQRPSPSDIFGFLEAMGYTSSLDDAKILV